MSEVVHFFYRASAFRRVSACCARAIFALALSGVSTLADQVNSGLKEEPLATRSVASGPTLFTELPPSQTGVVTENNYADPKMWWDLYHEFEIGEIGTGVTIGDYDGDGRPDIFVVSKTESCRLFRNLGNFKFEDVTEKAGVADHGDAAKIWKQGATFVDINNDGLLDIYVCRFNAPNLLYINQGDGTFKEMAHAYGLDVKDACVMAAFCDYDRDGWLDVFIQTNLLDAAGHPHGQRNYLFHNNRDGTFTNVTDHAGILNEPAQGHAAIWWDFDGDGWPDLYVANDFLAPDQLYHNNGDGTFTNVIDQSVPRMPFSSMGADFGDLNNDGLFDFITSDMASSTHEKDQRGMVNSRAQASEPPDNSNAAQQNYRNAVYINTGTGHFLEASFLTGLAATDWTWSMRLEDLDNDGRLDLFVTNGMHRESTNWDLLEQQMVSESPVERIGIVRKSPVMAQAHFAFRNLGDLKFEDVSAAWGLNKTSVAFGAAFGDLDGDGDLDLVYTNYQGGVTVMRNDSQTGHRVTIALRGVVSNRYGVGATVKIQTASGLQIRALTLSRGILSSSEPIIHFGLGEDTMIDTLTVNWPSGRVQTLVHLSADRHYTITEPADATPPRTLQAALLRPQFKDVSGELGLGIESKEDPLDETSQQRLLPVRLNRRGPGVAVGDLDGDGQDEIIIGGTASGAARMIQKSGASYISGDLAQLSPITVVDQGPVLIFDADGDGHNDLLITQGGNALPVGSSEYQPKLFLNDAHSGLRAAPADSLPSLPISAGVAVAADFDRDGRLDLFIGGRVSGGQYPLSPQSALLINRGGKFEDVTAAMAPGLREVGMVTSALWTDVDQDGWPDLLITLEWGQVKYFHNRQGKGFDDWTAKAGFAAAGTGWWNSIAAADFNGDGRLDYVVGNVGLNTQYHADTAHPALLFFGDFNNSGDEEPQIVEAYYEGDRLYPWRSRRDLGAAIPSVLKKYPKNDNYARATLGEILGEEKLAAAQRFSATELRSGVFLSQPDGTFRFEPLPRLAQIAPIYGLAAGDFDGDGHADIYAVQNSYAPIPAVGRFSGGLSLLLRGDGQGHFTPVMPAESGLVVTGDGKGLAVMDYNNDGWPDFFITRNNNTTIAYQNAGSPGRHSLKIQLTGTPGNLSAIGARITVKLADGLTQTGEISAGSGYYSQSSAACFFGYPDGNPIVSVEVNWPDGTRSQYPVTGSPSSLRFKIDPVLNR